MPPAHSHESGLYHHLSRLYDPVFGRAFRRRLHDTIQRLQIPAGARVLEVGVGTGISLVAYPRHAEVVGIDLSQEMLQRADSRVRQHGWSNISLRQMDALALEFPDGHFDYVMAFHVVSVVPEPQRLMQEMVRVTRPGGTIVIVNHFRSPRFWVAALVDLLDPLTRRLGWTTRLEIGELLDDWPLHVKRQYKSHPRSLYTILIAERQ